MRFATARPDLSALPREVRVRIAVAEMQGARWYRAVQKGLWELANESGLVGILTDAKTLLWGASPNPLTDPAAWGALMQERGVSVQRYGDGWNAWIRHVVDPTIELPSPGYAVCCALLTEAGIDWDTLEPIG